MRWRRAEARHVARRVKELVDTGAASPGEIVLLFAAGTDAEWYEEELRALGLPTYRATGRRYFGQQQRGGPRPPPRPPAATSASSRSSPCSRTCACCATATTTRRSRRCSPRRSSAS